LASHVAYAAARFDFKFKNVMLFAILMTSMIPGICIITSLYAITVGLTVHDTYAILIIVFSASQLPAQVWFLKGFFAGIPIELEESAKLEGVSTLGIFYRIVMPLSTPGLAAGSVLIFVNVWNDWLISSTLTITERMRLINVGLFDYIKDLGVDWGRFTGYALVSILPILFLFFGVQKYFIQGLTAGATKG
jgi:ABC-type glycerol-3-phosphate transport system permease component